MGEGGRGEGEERERGGRVRGREGKRVGASTCLRSVQA